MPPQPDAPSAEPLSPLEARVLGCLIEKELTTPEYYPLSLSARDVEIALDGLRRLRLAGLFSGADARVAKFKQTIDLVYPMEAADRVVLCELLLRGAQTTGELRGRCERMRSFPDVASVEACVERLVHRPAGPLVARLPRQPGQKEGRVAQLLTGEPDFSSSAGETEHLSATPLKVEVRLPAEAETRFAALEAEVASLRDQLADLRKQLGVS